MSDVMHSWYTLYLPVIQSMPIDFQEQEDVKALEWLATDANEALRDFFERYRPGLISAIRSEIQERRQVGKWPGQPSRLVVVDIQEVAYVQNLETCTDDTFITEVNVKMGAALNNQ